MCGWQSDERFIYSRSFHGNLGKAVELSTCLKMCIQMVSLFLCPRPKR